MKAETPIPNPDYQPNSGNLSNRESTYNLANKHRSQQKERLDELENRRSRHEAPKKNSL